MSVEQDRFAHLTSQPFQPQSLKPEFRIANALEYIAAQMGDINRKMSDLLEMQYKSTEALRGLDDCVGAFLSRTKP